MASFLPIARRQHRGPFGSLRFIFPDGPRFRIRVSLALARRVPQAAPGCSDLSLGGGAAGQDAPSTLLPGSSCL